MGVLRRRWPLFAVVAILVLLIGGAVGVYAYGRSQSDVIASGVRISGVDVGGLGAAAARRKVRRALVAPASRPIVVRAGRHRFRLTARRARVHVDVPGSVRDALTRSRQGSFVTHTVRAFGGDPLDVDLHAEIAYRRAAVRRLVADVRHAVERPARDAEVHFTPASVSTVPSRVGWSLSASRLERRIEGRLVHPVRPRTIHVRARRVSPKVTTGELAAKYPAIITLDRANTTLRLFRHLKLARTYTVAVGMQGLNTPAGLYHIQNKQVNPSWYVPHDSWAGSLQGRVIPPGPDDPLKARYMEIFNGAGIHGTDELASLGSAASHGCVRMRIPDVIDLYGQVSVGTPIYIGD